MMMLEAYQGLSLITLPFTWLPQWSALGTSQWALSPMKVWLLALAQHSYGNSTHTTIPL